MRSDTDLEQEAMAILLASLIRHLDHAGIVRVSELRELFESLHHPENPALERTSAMLAAFLRDVEAGRKPEEFRVHLNS